MKKTLAVTVCAIFLSALTAYAEGNIVEFRAGFSPSPKFDVTPSKKAKPSFEIGAEYRYAVTNNTEIGGGIAYQNHGKLKKFTDIEDSFLRVEVQDTKLYNSVPLYLTAKYNFRNDSDFLPYIKANLGYSFNSGSKSSNYKTYSKVTGAVLDEGKLKDFSVDDGIYYAVGAGMTYRGFNIDLSYQVNSADMKGTRYDGRTDSGRANNRRITLGFGYQFGF